MQLLLLKSFSQPPPHLTPRQHGRWPRDLKTNKNPHVFKNHLFSIALNPRRNEWTPHNKASTLF